MPVSGDFLIIIKPFFFWALFLFTFCNFLSESLVLEFLLAVESGVFVVLRLMFLDFLGFLDLLN